MENADLSVCRLSGCLITEDGCSSLADALSSSHSNLKELDLSYNHLGEHGQTKLVVALSDPSFRLNTLRYGENWCSEYLREEKYKHKINMSSVCSGNFIKKRHLIKG